MIALVFIEYLVLVSMNIQNMNHTVEVIEGKSCCQIWTFYKLLQWNMQSWMYFWKYFVGNAINVGKAQVFEYSRRFSSHEYLDFDCLLHFEWLFQSQNKDLVSLKNYVVTKRALLWVVKLCLYQFIWVSERVKYGIEYELQSKLWCLWSSQSCTRSTTHSTKFRMKSMNQNFLLCRKLPRKHFQFCLLKKCNRSTDFTYNWSNSSACLMCIELRGTSVQTAILKCIFCGMLWCTFIKFSYFCYHPNKIDSYDGDVTS